VERLVAQGEEGFLKMLREVTGTEAFDSKVERMSQVLSECETKKTQMDKILGAIKARLDQLGQEIEEYREIQKAERERKALEMALHTRRMEANRVEIEFLRGEKGRVLDKRQALLD
jgi:chromosome segregation ATPase